MAAHVRRSMVWKLDLAAACNTAEKARFYLMAKRSATECAGILDACQGLQLIEEERYNKGREMLIRIVSMLIKMAQK